MFYAEWIETPLGDMMAIADATSLHVLGFRDRMSRPEDIAALELRMGATVSIGGNAVTAQAVSDMAAYFAGLSATFSVPLSPAGSDFEKSVWRELLQVPLAETCSYGDIARKVGGLETVRAVGKANGANPIAIIIPCHRCIGSDGSLTGYGGGLWRKKWLLRHEGQMRPVGLFAN